MSEKARNHLLEAFWSLYRTTRLDQITVKEIAAKAGYNRSTFYEHFDDVQACLEELELGCLPEVEDLPPMFARTDQPPDLNLDFLGFYEKKAAYFNVLLGENGDPSFRRKLIERIKKAIVEEAATHQLVASLLPKDAQERDLVLEYRIGGLLAVLNYASTHPELASKEKLAKALVHLGG